MTEEEMGSIEIDLPDDRHRIAMYNDIVDQIGKDETDSILSNILSDQIKEAITRLYDNRDNIEIEE